MKKIIAFIVTFFAFAGLLYSQEPVMQWGPPIDEFAEKNTKIENIYLADDGGIYIYRTIAKMGMRDDYWIEKYDKTYKKVFSKNIIPAEGIMGDNILFRRLLFAKDKFLGFYSGFKKSDKRSFYLVKNIGLDGEMEKEGKEIESFSAEKAMNAGNYAVCLSPDGSKLLLVTTMPYNKEENRKIRVKVFDAQSMKELYSKDETLNFKDKGVSDDLLLDNNGNAFILERYENDKRTYVYNLYTLNLSSKTWKEIPINTEEKNLSNQNRFIFNTKGDVVFAGFFYNKAMKNYNGVFYIRIDAASQGIAVTKFMGYGDVSMKEKEDQTFPDWNLKDVVSQSNGNVLIIGEEEEEKMVVPAGGAMTMDRTNEYKTGKVKVACIQPDGNKSWITTVKKSQSCTTANKEKRWDSFAFGLVNDRLFIFYNNTELSHMLIQEWTDSDGKRYHKNKDFAMKTDYATFMYVIEPNGVSTYAKRTYGLPLLDFQKGTVFNMSLNPNSFFTLKDGILLMGEMSDGKKYKFGKMVL